MHELSIVEGIIAAVKREQKRHHFRKLIRVDIGCNVFSCIAEESLQFYFDSATKGTSFEGSRVRVRRLPQEYECGRCARVFVPKTKAICCPQCKTGTECRLRLKSDLNIEALEVE